MCVAKRREMFAGAARIWRAALAVLVNVKTVSAAGRQATHVSGDVNACTARSEQQGA